MQSCVGLLRCDVAPFFHISPRCACARNRVREPTRDREAPGPGRHVPCRLPHVESESRSRRRRGRCCGLWGKHKGNGVAPEGICAACRARSIRRSQLVGRGAAVSGQWAQRVGDQLVAEPDVAAAHDAQDSRWLQDSADSVAWAAHGVPESPHEVPRPG